MKVIGLLIVHSQQENYNKSLCDLKDLYTGVRTSAGVCEYAHVLWYSDENNLSWQAGYPYKFLIFCSDRALCVLSLIAADPCEPVTFKAWEIENKKIDLGRGRKERKKRENECGRKKKEKQYTADSNSPQTR